MRAKAKHTKATGTNMRGSGCCLRRLEGRDDGMPLGGGPSPASSSCRVGGAAATACTTAEEHSSAIFFESELGVEELCQEGEASIAREQLFL